MDIPTLAYGATVTEGKEYFFKVGCPIGVEDHIHICIYKGDKVFLFATGSSQLGTAEKRARILNHDPKTYPIFIKDAVNKFDKDTYVDCNKPIETTPEEFSNLIKKGLVYEMKGVLDVDSLNQIAEGVKLSITVEDRIKDMF